LSLKAEGEHAMFCQLARWRHDHGTADEVSLPSAP